LIALSVVSCVLLLSSPASASAGSFSAPVLLPGERGTDWRFAVNERGEAVTARASPKGALLYEPGHTTAIGTPIEVAAPGGYQSGELPSVALSAGGRVAVGLTFFDETFVSTGYVPVGVSDCCLRAAVSSWQLGGQPPPAQVLSARQPLMHGGGFPPQVFAAPEIVIGRSSIAALWTREDGSEGEGDCGPEQEPAQLEEAFGRIGEPLHVKQLTAARKGILLPHLSLGPDERPAAAWIENGDELVSVAGSNTGALDGSRQLRHLPGQCSLVGFADESDRATSVFAYFAGRGSHKHPVVITGRPGGRFGAPHRFTSTHEPLVLTLAGKRGFLVAAWERSFRFLEEDHLYVQQGSVSGRHGKIQALGFGSVPQMWVDSKGETVIVYQRPVSRHPARFNTNAQEVVATTARPGRPFGRPHPVAPDLGTCQLSAREKHFYPGRGYEETIATSPDGNAVFDVECGEEEPDERRYLIRYTP
jgi:hypothetical protein